MYDEAFLEQRFRLGEDSTTEFKGVAQNEYRIDGHDLSKAIVAMANTSGGLILLGVEDNGTPTGVGTAKQADVLTLQVYQLCAEAIRPAISCTVRKAEFRGHLLLVVEVPEFGPDRPYKAGKVFYVRRGPQSIDADPAELRRSLESVGYHFDERPVRDASSAKDLDDKASLSIIAQLYGPEFDRSRVGYYLRALNFLDAQENPTVAGILFVGRDPSRWLPDAKISAVRFHGASVSSEFEDRLEIEGRIPDQIDAAVGFMSRHLGSPSHVEGWNRVGTPGPGAIPVEALREALLNAVSHRDYQMASQVKIFIFDDRVEIINPGGLLNRMTLDSIRIAGIKQHRNPVIASQIARLMTSRRESLGIGFPEMVRLMTKRGLPEPEIGLEGGHFRLILKGIPTEAA